MPILSTRKTCHDPHSPHRRSAHDGPVGLQPIGIVMPHINWRRGDTLADRAFGHLHRVTKRRRQIIGSRGCTRVGTAWRSDGRFIVWRSTLTWRSHRRSAPFCGIIGRRRGRLRPLGCFRYGSLPPSPSFSPPPACPRAAGTRPSSRSIRRRGREGSGVSFSTRSRTRCLHSVVNPIRPEVTGGASGFWARSNAAKPSPLSVAAGHQGSH